MNRSMRLALPMFALLFVAHGTFAAPPPTKNFAQRPQLRMQQWQNWFHEFMTAHSDLSSEKVQALEDLSRIDDPSFFAAAPDPGKRDFLAERMKELGRILSFFEFQDLLDSSPTELTNWMAHSQVAPVAPTCNCDDIQDCGGNACGNVTCVHTGGTSHDGVCPSIEA
jgi:hypothetical protein